MAHHYSLAIRQAIGSNTIFWKLPDVTHFRSPFYGPVHACWSALRAINNIYRSLGVPATGIPLRHKYAKHAFDDTWAQVYRWLISYITPLSDGTPQTSTCTLYFWKINRQTYILQRAPEFLFTLARGFLPFKVIQGR